MARASRAIALCRARWPSRAAANFAIPRASPPRLIAKFGAEQPSTPQPATVSPVTSSVAARIATCNGWSISTYSGPAFRCWTTVRNPECLPEQLLCNWQGASCAQISRSRSSRSSGSCAPQRRSASPSPRSASQRPAMPTCSAAPWWLAQASARWASDSPRAAAAPVSINGSAWIILHDERGKITASGLPQASITPPGIADHRMAQMHAFQHAPAPQLGHRNGACADLCHDPPPSQSCDFLPMGLSRNGVFA
jgi:hypothetical protein